MFNSIIIIKLFYNAIFLFITTLSQDMFTVYFLFIHICIFKLYYLYFVYMCGVKGQRWLCDLNLTSSSLALATRHIRIVLLVNSPNKLNLLSWLLIYLCNK